MLRLDYEAPTFKIAWRPLVSPLSATLINRWLGRVVGRSRERHPNGQRVLKSPQTSLTIMNSRPENRHIIAVTMVNEVA